MPKYSKSLIQLTTTYFKNTYKQEITEEQAIQHLESLSALYGAFVDVLNNPPKQIRIDSMRKDFVNLSQFEQVFLTGESQTKSPSRYASCTLRLSHIATSSCLSPCCNRSSFNLLCMDS
jgi:hypothetical protein